MSTRNSSEYISYLPTKLAACIHDGEDSYELIQLDFQLTAVGGVAERRTGWVRVRGGHRLVAVGSGLLLLPRKL